MKVITGISELRSVWTPTVAALGQPLGLGGADVVGAQVLHRLARISRAT